MVMSAAVSHPRFTDIVSATDLPKSSVHRILTSLTQCGFLLLSDDNTYLPGLSLLSLAGRAFESVDIRASATPAMVKLAKKTGCQVHLAALNGFEAIYVAVLAADKPYRMPSEVGGRIPLYRTSLGKALLAHFPPDQLTSYLNSVPLTETTPRTITDPQRLRHELELVRETRFAIDNEENVPGIRCIASPICDYLNRVRYAISVSTLALDTALDVLEEFSTPVIAAAGEITRVLGGHVPTAD